jgi:hypothetical protein
MRMRSEVHHHKRVTPDFQIAGEAIYPQALIHKIKVINVIIISNDQGPHENYGYKQAEQW